MIGRRALLGSMALTLAAGASLGAGEISEPADPADRVVSAGRAGRRDGPAHRATAVDDARPGDRREPPRRRGNARRQAKSRCAEPDGYTIMLGSTAPLAIGPALYPNSGYDPRTAFVPIAHVFDTPYIMVGAMNAPFKTVPELLAYARANPGRLTFGVPNGAPPHMLAEMFRMQTGADIVIVPYRGASTLITDMIAGRIHGGFETTSVMLGRICTRARSAALAVLRDARCLSFPTCRPWSRAASTASIGSSWIGRASRRRHADGDRRGGCAWRSSPALRSPKSPTSSRCSPPTPRS